MAAYDPKRARTFYRLIIIIYMGAGALLPLQLWGTLRLANVPTPFQNLAFGVRTEIIIAVAFAAVAFLAALSVLTKSRFASYVCISYCGLQTAHIVVETVLTYSTKQYFPGPKWGSIMGAMFAIVSLVVLSWFLLTWLPRIMRDA
jgi:hypothetical protein